MAVTYMTAEGLQKLKDELRFLESTERPRVIAAIAEARDKGDLSENAEYDAAKEEQGVLESKIAMLKGKIMDARIIDQSQLNTYQSACARKEYRRREGISTRYRGGSQHYGGQDSCYYTYCQRSAR